MAAPGGRSVRYRTVTPAQATLASAGLRDGLTERLLALLSQNAFTVAGIMFVSISAACGLVSIVNSVRGDATDFGDDAYRRKFNRQSQAMAHAFGFLFSAGGVYGYLAGGLAERAYLTLMLALIAGGCSPAFYDGYWWLRDKAGPAAGRALIEAMRAFLKLLATKLAAGITVMFKNRPKPPPGDGKP